MYNRYGTRRAYNMALRGVNPLGESAFPVGKAWVAPETESTSTVLAPRDPKTSKRKKKVEAAVSSARTFVGDQSLAQSIMLIHTLLISREMASAVAEGDIGRVYEGLKVCRQVQYLRFAADIYY